MKKQKKVSEKEKKRKKSFKDFPPFFAEGKRLTLAQRGCVLASGLK